MARLYLLAKIRGKLTFQLYSEYDFTHLGRHPFQRRPETLLCHVNGALLYQNTHWTPHVCGSELVCRFQAQYWHMKL